MTKADDRTGKTEDELFVQKAKTLFEQSVDGLDGQTRSRLNQNRQLALAELDSGTANLGRWMHLAPAAGVAAVAVVAVVLWNANPSLDAGTSPGDSIESGISGDFELLMAEESFDMLQDLDFYSWVEIDTELDTATGEDADVG